MFQAKSSFGIDKVDVDVDVNVVFVVVVAVLFAAEFLLRHAGALPIGLLAYRHPLWSNC